jgi:hypothetical protein
LGELIVLQKKTVGLNKGGGEKGVGRKGKNALPKVQGIKPTLEQAGIDKKLSSAANTATASASRPSKKASCRWRTRRAWMRLGFAPK